MKRLGPDLKKPEMKAPRVLVDLFQDLRDRRLLPLLAVILAAIVAVPIVLKDRPEEAAEEPVPGLATGEIGDQASQLTVVRATPGLRDYRKRLKAQTATNPFKQRYTAPVLKGAKLRSVSPTDGDSSSESKTGEGGGPKGGGGAATEPAPPSNGGSGGNPTGLRFFSWKMKVQISKAERKADGSAKMGPFEVRENVRALTPLPGKKQPVVTFMGVNPATKKALLMVSKEVTSMFGDAKCASGTSSCELLEMEEGFPETLTYGPNEVRYTFKVVSVDLFMLPKPKG